MIISSVPSEWIDVIWRDVEPMLERAIAPTPGAVTTATLRREIEGSKRGLWVVMDDTAEDNGIIAAFTTRIYTEEAGRVISTEYLAGSRMSEWIADVVNRCADYGREHDCIRMEMTGRMGWQKVLQKLGGTIRAIIISKDL